MDVGIKRKESGRKMQKMEMKGLEKRKMADGQRGDKEWDEERKREKKKEQKRIREGRKEEKPEKGMFRAN